MLKNEQGSPTWAAFLINMLWLFFEADSTRAEGERVEGERVSDWLEIVFW